MKRRFPGGWQIFKASVMQCTESFFPEKRKEIAVVFLLSWAVWAFFYFQSEKSLEKILRPIFSEDRKSAFLEYEWQGERRIQDRITIPLIERKTEGEERKKQLELLAERMKKKVLVKERWLNRAVSLPKTVSGVSLHYRIEPETAIFDNGDWNYFGLFAKEDSRTIKIFATLSAEEVEVPLQVEWQIKKAEFRTEYLQELLEKGLMMVIADAQDNNLEWLVLPTNLNGGQIRWKLFQGKISLSEMMGFSLLILGMLAILSRSVRKEKKQRQKKHFLQEFMQFLYQLVLMMRAGQSPYQSLYRICARAHSSCPQFRDCMQECYQRLSHQEPLERAIAVFEKPYKIEEIQRFTVVLERGHQKGDEWSIRYLEELKDSMFEARLRKAEESMQKASTRLVFPMVMFFIIIVVVTIFPAFAQSL